MKDKNNFFIKRHIAFLSTNIYFILGDIFFKIAKNLITSFNYLFFFAEADTKKHRYASAKASNAAAKT